jgi:tRNA (guanine37-N1)-methyltransferase
VFAASIITLFPEAFPGTLGVSLIGKALREGAWSLDTVQLRDFGVGPHKSVDDTPAGGGAGMVIRADVAAAAIDSIPRNDRPLIYLSPRGRQLTQAMAHAWAMPIPTCCVAPFTPARRRPAGSTAATTQTRRWTA